MKLIQNDKLRYNTVDPSSDFLALGESDQLAPLDKTYIRHALSFLDANSFADRDRAVRFMLSRIRQYYDVIGYVGPYVSKTGGEIGFALGEWIVERGYSPWRKSIMTTNRYAWEHPEKVFNQVRFACFESTLKLAEWEISQEVPESSDALHRAVWLARSTLQHHADCWRKIRNRWGTCMMRKHLDSTIDSLKTCELIGNLSTNWLGHYAKKENINAV